jgi:tetratricopeptide (TPR) repeat protein
MQTAANNNLVSRDDLSLNPFFEQAPRVSYGGSHQQIALKLIRGLQTKQSLIDFARRLVSFVEYSYELRQMDQVEQISQLLINLPLPKDFRQIGQYHLAVCMKRQGKVDEAQAQFETLASEIRHRYKSRALMSLAALAMDRNDSQAALPLYVEASRVAASKETEDIFLQVGIPRMIAVVKSLEGDHTGALSDLNGIFPIVRAVGKWQPSLLHAHLNSLAVELGEIGRIEEAIRYSELAMASPYAHAYPEWRETRDELVRKSRPASRAFVAGSKLPVEASNVTYLPFAGYASNFNSPQAQKAHSQQARIFRFEEWNKMSKEPTLSKDKLARPQLQQMSISEKQAALLKLIYADNVSEQMLDKLLKAAEEATLGTQVSS